MSEIRSWKMSWEKQEVGKCPKLLFLTRYAFSTSPLELGHWEPETIEKSDLSHILLIPLFTIKV